MYAHTKKVGVAGKFGTRVGRRIREELKKIHEAKKESSCLNCGSRKVKRLSAGIWKCRKCHLEFTGRAYALKTPSKIKEKRN